MTNHLDGLRAYSNGDKYWYKAGERHREDGPAIELSNGSKYWYQKDIIHREDGPAVEYANGFRAWYLNGEMIDIENNEQFLRIVKLRAFL